MAGNTEQKIKNLQFKRNKTIFSSFDELVATVKNPAFLRKTEIVEMQDGELLMFRYKDSTGNIATLVGSVYNPDSTTKEIHLEIGTDKIKKIIQEELKNIGDNQSKITINSADKILSLGSDNTLTAKLNLVKSGDTLKLIGKNNLVISTITLPKSESTIDSLSFNWLPQEAKLQLISNDNVLSEVDFPFETMVQSSELTTDNKLKLVFNTTKGPQSVLVDLNKLKDIYTAGDSTISVTGNKISTKVSSKTTSLPITKETDGLWVNDAKLTETVNDLNSLKTKVSNLETGSGSGIEYLSGDSVIDIVDNHIYVDVSSDETKLPLKKKDNGLWVDDTFVKEQQKNITSIDSRVTTLESDSYYGGDGTIEVTGKKITTNISKEPSNFSLEKKRDGLWINDRDYKITKNKISSISQRVSDIENNPMSSGDSTIEVTNNKISTKISSTGSYIPLIKKNDGLWVDDSDYNKRTSDLTNRITNIETSIQNGLIPSLSENFEEDIIEIYVGFSSSIFIKNLLLGSGMKSPYNFVMKYNGGSYDPNYNIQIPFLGACQVGNSQKFCIIESMNHSKWLHSCNTDFNNFDGDPDSMIQIKEVYIPTSLYIYTSNNHNPSIIYNFLKQFNNGFSYDGNGEITISKVSLEEKSFLIKNSTAIEYRLQSYSFLDSTLFFNQAMQGKYIPFIWKGKLKYFHFNHEL